MSDSDLQMEAPLRALYLITSPVSARFLRGQLAFMRRHGVRCVVGTGAGDGEFDDGVESFDVGFSREIRLVRDLMSLAKTVRLIRRLRPDIVNASTPKAGLVGTLAAAACRVERRVYVVRGLRYETARGTRRRVLAGLERLTMRLAHVVVFNSPSLLERARADGVCRPSTGIVLGAGSGNGIDTRRFSQLVPGDEARRRLGLENVAGLIIGFVGRLTNDKGVGDLLRAFDIVRSDHPGARLVLVGAPEDGDRLPIEATERIARGDGVVSTGWLDDPVPLLTGFDVLAFPSYREGLPNVPLEAQLSGVPVVGYAATGTVDAVDDGRSGLLVSVGDVAGLAESLTSMTDDAVRRRMGDHGRRWVTANFSQQRIWSELLDVYRPQPLAGARTDGAAS